MDNILVIAAHPDDETLGCGGTILKHSRNGDQVNLLILSKGVDSRDLNDDGYTYEEKKEALHREAENASSILGISTIEIHDFPDNQFDTLPLLTVTKRIEKTIRQLKPSVIYTHFWGDLNVDHQVVSRATLTACRPSPDSSVRSIFCYEVLSSTDWALSLNSQVFVPNRFVDISSTLDQKLVALTAYASELRAFPHSRSLEAANALAALRGSSCGIEAAEAFVTIRNLV